MKNVMLLLSLLSALFFTSLINASESYISKKSPYSVQQTLDRLDSILKSKGISVFTRVDHGAGAKSVGQSLQTSQLLIFGNPKLGSPLMREAPMMGLELPMKALAWEDTKGQVWLSYLKPSVLESRHGLKNKAVIEKMTKALNGMTNKAVSQ